MSKKKTIDRKTILTALRYEPLKRGKFIQDVHDDECKVCAVGAVLRRSGMEGGDISRFGTQMYGFGPVSAEYSSLEANHIISQLLGKGQFLHALSVKFETQAKRTGAGKRTRAILSKFVKENFPNKIELNPQL